MELAILGGTLAALATGAYFFFGPKGKVHQRHAKAWAIKMKGDVIAKLEKAKKVSEPVYHAIIDSVSSQYVKGMKAGRNEVQMLAQDLKKHWKTVTKSMRG